MELSAALDVVARSRTMEVRRNLQRHDVRTAPAQVDDDAVNLGQDIVSGERVFPRGEVRMTTPSVDEIHLTHSTFVLLKRGNSGRVWRPHQDGPVRARPSRIVGGVSEVLRAVRGQLRFPAAR